ncbi:heterochromatin protein 1 [Aphelenchoides avenae]|nr:heterochromatin protein 1 [Aphelenchus avenae]
MIRAEEVTSGESIVEKVVAKRFRKGILEYKVLIRDSDNEVVWLPSDSFGCAKLKQDFEELHKNQFPEGAPVKKASAPSSDLMAPQSLISARSASASKQSHKRKKISSASSCGTLPLPAPGKVYRCQRGSKIEKVLGVRPHTAPFNIIALVQYDNGTLEIVPTRIVAETDPDILIDYYEQRVGMPCKKPDAPKKMDAVSKPTGRRRFNVLARK